MSRKPLFVLLLSCHIAMPAWAQEYRSSPISKHECQNHSCIKVADGFQQAESFGYDTASSRLTACLWTHCMAGKAEVLPGENGTITAIAALLPDQAQSGVTSSRVVSLTLDQAGNFNAVRSYGGGDSLVFDTGLCVVLQ